MDTKQNSNPSAFFAVGTALFSIGMANVLIMLNVRDPSEGQQTFGYLALFAGIVLIVWGFILKAEARAKEYPLGSCLPKPSIAVACLSVVLAVSFFMPWIGTAFGSVSGATISRQVENAGWCWLIPVLSAITFSLTLAGKDNRKAGIATGLVPLLAIGYVVIRLDANIGTGSTVKFLDLASQLFSFGAWLTISSSIALVVASLLPVGCLSTILGRSLPSEKSGLPDKITQLERLAALYEKGVLNEEEFKNQKNAVLNAAESGKIAVQSQDIPLQMPSADLESERAHDNDLPAQTAIGRDNDENASSDACGTGSLSQQAMMPVIQEDGLNAARILTLSFFKTNWSQILTVSVPLLLSWMFMVTVPAFGWITFIAASIFYFSYNMKILKHAAVGGEVGLSALPQTGMLVDDIVLPGTGLLIVTSLTWIASGLVGGVFWLLLRKIIFFISTSLKWWDLPGLLLFPILAVVACILLPMIEIASSRGHGLSSMSPQLIIPAMRRSRAAYWLLPLGWVLISMIFPASKVTFWNVLMLVLASFAKIWLSLMTGLFYARYRSVIKL